MAGVGEESVVGAEVEGCLAVQPTGPVGTRGERSIFIEGEVLDRWAPRSRAEWLEGPSAARVYDWWRDGVMICLTHKGPHWLWLLKRWVAFRLMPLFGKKIVHCCGFNGKSHYWRGRVLWGFNLTEETLVSNDKPGGWIPIPRGYSFRAA